MIIEKQRRGADEYISQGHIVSINQRFEVSAPIMGASAEEGVRLAHKNKRASGVPLSVAVFVISMFACVFIVLSMNSLFLTEGLSKEYHMLKEDYEKLDKDCIEKKEKLAKIIDSSTIGFKAQNLGMHRASDSETLFIQVPEHTARVLENAVQGAKVR